MTNNVLVVGGKGYIGSHLQLHCPNYIYTSSEDFDLNHIREIQNFCAYLDIDMCIILSGKILYTKDANILEEPFKSNVHGLNNLLITLKKKNKNIKIVYFSSMTVYDTENNSPVLETSNLLPSHGYGLSKVYAEELIKFYKLKSVILRIPGVYGGNRKSGFIYNTIKKLEKNEAIDIDTETLGYWEAIHINDLIELLINFLSKYEFNDTYQIFNLSYGEKTDFIETAYFLKNQLSSNSLININKRYNEIYLSNKKLLNYTTPKHNYYSRLKQYIQEVAQ